MIDQLTQELNKKEDIEIRIAKYVEVVDKGVASKADIDTLILLTIYNPFQDWLTRVHLPSIDINLSKAKRIFIKTADDFYI